MNWMKRVLTTLALLAATSCSALGIGGEIEVTEADHATLDAFLDYNADKGRVMIHEFLDEETALAIALRYWRAMVIGTGDPDNIFGLNPPEPETNSGGD